MTIPEVEISNEEHILTASTETDTPQISDSLVTNPASTNKIFVQLKHDRPTTDNHNEDTGEEEVYHKTYQYWRALKIVSQRNNNEQTQYLIQWEDRSLPDRWCNAADVENNLRREFYFTHTDAGEKRSETLKDTTDTTMTMTHNTEIPTQEPQPTMEIEIQNIFGQRDLMDDAIFDLIRQKTPVVQKSPTSAAEATINIVGQKKGKRTKTPRVAIQILQQETKHDKIRYFMRWENPKAEKSWCWAEDVNEDLKRTFYKNNPLEVAPQIESMNDTNEQTSQNDSQNDEIMSH